MIKQNNNKVIEDIGVISINRTEIFNRYFDLQWDYWESKDRRNE